MCRAIKPNVPVYRAKFSEITQVAVKRALANLVDPDELQNKAVNVRTELDLRIGKIPLFTQIRSFCKCVPYSRCCIYPLANTALSTIIPQYY